MIRLLIDGTPVTANMKGVGRYAYQLCMQLAARLPSNWQLQVLVHPASRELFSSDFRGTLIPLRETSEIVRALFVTPGWAGKFNPTLFLKTHENAGLVHGVPTVTICHDIDHLITLAQSEKRSPRRVALDNFKHYLRRHALRKSDFVICNSEFTRQAIIKYYRIAPDRTALAYCAVDPRFYEISQKVDKIAVRKKYGVGNFILAFATGDARENFRCYPAVVAKMKALGVCSCLLVAGVRRDQPYARAMRNEFVSLGMVEGRQFLFEDFLGAERFYDLASLYSAADLYLDLSLHEGFGMQLAEAMACGTTCISSSRGALPEVGNGHVLFVDPTDQEGIAQTVKTAYAKGLQLRDNREQVSYTRKFSWDSVGSSVTEALSHVAAKMRPV